MHVRDDNNNDIASIRLPDSPMAQAAVELIRDAHSTLMLNHSKRVFLFATLIGEQRQVPFDEELLYVGALFHRVGLTARYRRSQNRFEIDGATAAREFLKGFGCSHDDAQEVWDAIALHSTPGIPEHKSHLVALIAAGVDTDLYGRHRNAISPAELTQILQAFPREPGFNAKLLNAMAAGLKHRPHTAFGTVNADVLERLDKQYKRANFCTLLLETRWPFE
ncbi:phosphohydrolase [Pseudomonas syringae]|uniref:Phosphohydrolase n=1 Tax=Pseudomonas syringae TaxID=317 RepID=A0A1C7Z840_PSESX|nr:HD domain-containing protein [Pseudomonas syringae]OCR25216.1 phosphohydrolase [Pseudomonas syringae]